jgi:Flp pilus assembly pilin Flp
MKPWLKFIRDDRGASSVEYAILISGIAAVIFAAITYFGQAVAGLYNITFP